MISVVFYKNKDGALAGFDCSGHAGYARHGEDIICAAFSMLVINTITSLEAFTGTVPECTDDEAQGTIVCRFPAGVDEKGTVLMNALILGVDSIKREYGEQYISTDVRQL